MKMKKIINIKCLALILGLFAMTVSCTNDDLTKGDTKGDKQTDGTVFVGGKSSASASAKSRTAFNYLPSIGANSKFVWTRGDRIFLADGSVSEPLTGGYDEKFDVADFVFRGKNFTAPSYDIYYPGYGGTTFNKLTIPTDYNGNAYYDYQNIGKFYAYPRGDGGFAKAIRQPDGKYYFELEHLCAFLYLTPYVQTDRLGEAITVKNIKITADKNIAGDFTITPTGLVESANGSKTIETNSQSTISGTIGGPLGIYSHGTQKIRDYTSWLFHFAPANTKLKIEYKISIPVYECGRQSWAERIDSIVTKNIPLYSYGKNTVTPITSSIFFPMYKAIYSRWDAKKDYSEFADTVTASNSVSLSDKYQNNTDYQGNKTSLVATRLAKDCPNRIEAAWYAMHGDPYYDENYIWTNGKDICRGAVWIKKKSEIPGFSSTSLPSDVTWTNDGCANTSIKKGRPADTSKYFVLPSLGHSYGYGGNLSFYFANNGYYWTKDAVDNDYAWILYFYKDAIRVQKWYKFDLNALWAVQ